MKLSTDKMRAIQFCLPVILGLLLVTCPLTSGRGGRGGGGSRGGGSRSSSSRSSSSRSSSSSSSSSHTSRGSSYNFKPSYSVHKPAPHIPTVIKAPTYTAVKPSAPVLPSPPKTVYNPAYNPHRNQPPDNPAYDPNRNQPPDNPAYNAHWKQPPNNPAYNPLQQAGRPGHPPPYPGPNQPQPPSYPGLNQGPLSYPGLNQGPPPPYSFNQARPGGYPQLNPPPYPSINHGIPPNHGTVLGQPNYGANPYQPNTGQIRPYPQQPGMGNAPYPRQPGMGNAPYPQQPGMGNMPYPQQTGGYYPPSYGGGYSGYGAGTSINSVPLKKKGFLGSLFSSKKGGHKSIVHSGGSSFGDMRGISYASQSSFGKSYGWKSGHSKSLNTILPVMAASRMKRPRFGGIHYYSGMPYHSYGGYHSRHYVDIEDSDYRGSCHPPITPIQSSIRCITTKKGAKCEAECFPGHSFSDNSTRKENECWHITGVWRPTRNFGACQPICKEICQNGGKCSGVDTCTCLPEYRGPKCDHHILKCDIRKLAGPNRIGWACSHTRNETVCTAKCRSPNKFATGPESQKYSCQPNGTWSNSSMPECVDGENYKTTVEPQLEILVDVVKKAEENISV